MIDKAQDLNQKEESLEKNPKRILTLSKKNGDLKKASDGDRIRQNFSHGRSKTVEVEVRRKRTSSSESRSQLLSDSQKSSLSGAALGQLTEGEKETRIKAVQQALQSSTQDASYYPSVPMQNYGNPPHPVEDKTPLEESVIIDTPINNAVTDSTYYSPKQGDVKASAKTPRHESNSHDIEGDTPQKAIRMDHKKSPQVLKRSYDTPKRLDRHTLARALNDDLEEQRLKATRKTNRKVGANLINREAQKVIREVIIPETIAVSELANRMAVRVSEVVKILINMGTMATVNQFIDADTAELVCVEFGHKPKRMIDSDIEQVGLEDHMDSEEYLQPRPPVVTIMGHVDHGKTSLLDALRKTDVVSGEAGGITQHIGAYQITLKTGQKITFIDTPGHAAFTAMRARGAKVTDIVILVVAADDGVKDQTIEAIHHTKAANVPMIVAINKIDKQGSNPDRVREELLQHGIVLEEYGGDTLSVEVSAKELKNLNKLEEVILLQAEILDLKANPNRSARGVIVEAKMQKGRGTVSTALIQKGTLRIGDIIVSGIESGRVRAMVNDRGHNLEYAIPGMPVEILGFNGVPIAGEDLIVVDSESVARDLTTYRKTHKRNQATIQTRHSLQEQMSQIGLKQKPELALVIKADVHGSFEAIAAALLQLNSADVSIKILHGAVGGINESDVHLAMASHGIIIGFNVRANQQAQELARKEKIDIRYYSIIYNILDDLQSLCKGLLEPVMREKILGQAEIRAIFEVGKTSKIAGCFVLNGLMKRGTKIRLLRDHTVIHEGDLKSLRRFKEEVQQVKESYECGIVLENYKDFKEKDIIECYEMELTPRI